MSTRFFDASLRQQIRSLTANMEPATRRAFLASIEDIRSRVVLRRVRDALEAGNVSAVVSALNLEAAAYAPLQQAVLAAYAQGGQWQMDNVVWRDPNTLSKVVVRWDMTNPRATDWLANYSSTKITGDLIDDQVQAVQRVIAAGYNLGRGPNDIALDIVGRIGANGRRTGGVVGLSEQMAGWSTNMRTYLTNDPARALQMTKRDRRFDATIRRALENDKPLTRTQINRMVARYEDRLLKLRGNTIGRTETAQAVNAARIEAMRQGMVKAGITDDMIDKIWFHGGPAPSGKERFEHIMLHKQEVQGINTPFMVGGIVPMQYPLDPAAPVDQVANCRCSYQISVAYEKMAR